MDEANFEVEVELRPEPCVVDPNFGLPIVTGTIHGSSKLEMDFLIDTGADITVISQRHALVAGLDKMKSEDIIMNGVAGGRKVKLLREVKIDLYGVTFSIPVMVDTKMGPQYGILGRAVLFKNLRVQFRDGLNKLLIGFGR
jgi:predicted aspartyl protease